MSNDIFIAKGTSKTGPYSIDQIKQMVADGKASLSDLAWHKGMSGWKPIGEIEGVTEFPPLPTNAKQDIPPLPTKSKMSWQFKTAIAATIAFIICLLSLVGEFRSVTRAVSQATSANSVGEAAANMAALGYQSGQSDNGSDLTGFLLFAAFISFIVSVGFSIWLLGKGNVEKWKPIAILVTDGASIIIFMIIAAS